MDSMYLEAQELLYAYDLEFSTAIRTQKELMDLILHTNKIKLLRYKHTVKSSCYVTCIYCLNKSCLEKKNATTS
jgi:hypothetical protein